VPDLVSAMLLSHNLAMTYDFYFILVFTVVSGRVLLVLLHFYYNLTTLKVH